MQAPTSASKHYRRQQRLQAMTLVALRTAWRQMRPDRPFDQQVEESVGPAMLTVLLAAQSTTLGEAEAYQAQILAELGIAALAAAEAPPVIDPTGFLGYAGDGREIAGLLGQAASVAGRAFNRLTAPAQQPVSLGALGAPPAASMPTVVDLAGASDAAAAALAEAERWVEMIAETIMADTARAAESVAFTAEERVTGYVRVLSPPSCARCAILAGRKYRWNEGFLRHPRCNCFHVPTAESVPDETTDPYAYFQSLSEVEQDKAFTKAGAQAIRDGADISQVVNARRGMSDNGMRTTEGMTRRGNASRVANSRFGRATPEQIYQWARGDRQAAIRHLKANGYILDAGQVPEGALRGQREGFGQLGGGGQRRAATAAVLEARETGVRDPNSRYTMTAAERRLYDAKQRYQQALRGIDPYTSPGFGNTPDPYGQRLNRVGAETRSATPEVLDRAKREYLRWLASNGQFYT